MGVVGVGGREGVEEGLCFKLINVTLIEVQEVYKFFSFFFFFLGSVVFTCHMPRICLHYLVVHAFVFAVWFLS